jgi:hypothetical protein
LDRLCIFGTINTIYLTIIMEKRHVPVTAIFKLLRGRKPFGIIGLFFIIISLASVIVMFAVESKVSEPYAKYDHAAINQKGVNKDGVITGLDSKTNVSVNGEHPVVISYDYKEGGKTVSDKFQTFELQKIANFKQGDAIKIKSYNNQSLIAGLEPYSFPFYLVLIGPTIFLLVGTIFFMIGFIPAYRIYKLYQTGIVKEATVFSMLADSGNSRNNFGRAIIVNYYYFDSRSNKIFGTTITSDLSVLHEMRPDDKTKIFVSETDETKSCLVPKTLAIKNKWKI